MAKKRKKRTEARERNWRDAHEYAFSHDRIKHLRAKLRVTDAAPQAPLPSAFEPNGFVIAHSKKWAFVKLEDGERLCKIDERLVNEESSLLAPGDRVLVEFESEDAFVRGIGPRRTKLSRPAPANARPREQVFAANIDRLIVVASAAEPVFNPGLIDRYLIAAQVSGVEAVLCVNKSDLAAAEPAELPSYREMGIRVFTVSCKTGAGIEIFRDALRDSTGVLSGHSGVGKTSLLNALDPNLRLITREVSEVTGKGRHTTTSARLYELAGGIQIIDTPGIRALGLWSVGPAETSYYFPDLAESAVRCKFRDCTHTHEPHCAVHSSVEDGKISRARFESYLRIRKSLEEERKRTMPG